MSILIATEAKIGQWHTSNVVLRPRDMCGKLQFTLQPRSPVKLRSISVALLGARYSKYGCVVIPWCCCIGAVQVPRSVCTCVVLEALGSLIPFDRNVSCKDLMDCSLGRVPTAFYSFLLLSCSNFRYCYLSTLTVPERALLPSRALMSLQREAKSIKW